MMMLILIVALRRAHNLRRSDVAKYRVSEQDEIGEHRARLGFGGQVVSFERRASKELSSA